MVTVLLALQQPMHFGSAYGGWGGKQTQHISSNEEQEVADEVNRVS